MKLNIIAYNKYNKLNKTIQNTSDYTNEDILAWTSFNFEYLTKERWDILAMAIQRFLLELNQKNIDLNEIKIVCNKGPAPVKENLDVLTEKA